MPTTFIEFLYKLGKFNAHIQQRIQWIIIIIIIIISNNNNEKIIIIMNIMMFYLTLHVMQHQQLIKMVLLSLDKAMKICNNGKMTIVSK